MKNSCVIISGGEHSKIPELSREEFVIACDRGYEYALEQNVTPSLIIGDFDSYAGTLPDSIPVLRYPSVKDDTDTMIAVKYAVEHGYARITLCCALGGRLDHEYANIQGGIYAAERGVETKIDSENTKILFVKDASVSIPRLEGFALSVFSVSERCSGVCERGTKYLLTDAELTNSFPLGVSNEWAQGEAEISVSHGTLMIILSRKVL